ncbi:unknown [Alistipes sp. CAG:831]|nr:unknown [Alistipes sp. CAG:831]
MTEPDPGTEYTTKLTFDNPVSIPVEYNALAGDVTSATNDNDIFETPACTSTFEDGTGLCLFTGYIFVPKQKSNKYSFTIVVSDENNQSVAKPVSDITVRRNALTTVKGKIL